MAAENLEYENLFEQFHQPFTVESNCSGIVFINYGTSVAYINFLPIAASGGAYSPDTIGTNNVEIDRSKYRLTFDTSGGTMKVMVIRKLYKSINYVQ